MSAILEVVDYFKSLHRLENVHIYLTNSNENHLINYYKKNNIFVKSVESANVLLKNLIIINENSETSVSNENQYRKLKSKRSFNFKPTNGQQKLNFTKSFRDLELFFNSNDLVFIKCSLNKLYNILKAYTELKDKYFTHHLSNISFFRYMIWIPEPDPSYQSNLNEENELISKLSKICHSFKIFVLNWLVDVDVTLNKIIEQTVYNDLFNAKTNFNNLNSKFLNPDRNSNDNFLSETFSSGKFSLKHFFTFKRTFDSGKKCEAKEINDLLMIDEFLFKIKDNKIYFLDDNIQDNFDKYSNFKRKKRNEVSFKPTYRIVSNQVEPFVIVSQLDEHLISKDECKDGLPCLDIESDEIPYSRTFTNNINLTEEMNNIFNKELMIGLIKSFKYFSDERIQSSKTSLVKTKCCTGYMINLLQRLSQDLDFEFDFYFSPDKKFGHFDNESLKWNGALNQVISGIAHVAAGPFSITEDRAKFIDFSAPFLFSGYGLLIKQEKKGVNDLFMFLKPFTYLNWIIFFLFTLVFATALAFFEFNSPFGLNPKGRQRARNFTLGSAISMVFSLIFMHTMPGKSPKSWSGKYFLLSFAFAFDYYPIF